MFPYIFYIFHKYLNNEYSLEGLRTQDSLFILQSSFQGTSNSIQSKTKSYDTYKFHALNHTTFQPKYWSMTHKPSWTPILVIDTYFIHCMPHLQQNQGKTLVFLITHLFTLCCHVKPTAAYFPGNYESAPTSMTDPQTRIRHAYKNHSVNNLKPICYPQLLVPPQQHPSRGCGTVSYIN